MFRFIGKIVLLVVGVAMIGSGVYFLAMVSIPAIGSEAGGLIEGVTGGTIETEKLIDLFLPVVAQLLIIIAGMSAFLSGFTGNCGYWFVVFAIMQAGAVVLLGKTGAGDAQFKGIGQFMIEAVLLAGYLAGFILLRIGKHRGN